LEHTKKRPTIRDIAKLAGVSHVTVSRALRSNPRISAPTRERIKKIANEIGYRPDPVLSALMTYRLGIRQASFQGTIGWLNTWGKPDDLRVFFGDYWDGAAERCESYGYLLEDIRFAELGTREQAARRVSRILRARNIQGILLPPQEGGNSVLDLDWSQLSVVTFGFTVVKPQFHAVANAQMRSCTLAIRKLRERGYKRIAYVVSRAFHERTGHNFTGAYLVDQESLNEEDRIPPLYIDYSPGEEKAVRAWYKKYKPDVIIMEGATETRPELEKIINPRQCSLASLSVPAGSDLAGIRQNNAQIGRVAVEQLVARMQQGERGVPQVPYFCLIEGEWIEGRSLSKPAPRVPTALAPI
jgi:LacI family transcriptional regulator